jgi:hypothetical protein
VQGATGAKGATGPTGPTGPPSLLFFSSHGTATANGNCLIYGNWANQTACATSSFAANATGVVFGPVPSETTISNLRATTTSTGTGQTITVTVNNENTALACTFTAVPGCSNTTSVVTIPANAFLQVKVTGTPTAIWAVVFQVG